jgi:hypothetical protein
MNTILEDFVELKEVIKSFDGIERNFNWLLTDLDWSYPANYLDYFIDYRVYDNRSTYCGTQHQFYFLVKIWI